MAMIQFAPEALNDLEEIKTEQPERSEYFLDNKIPYKFFFVRNYNRVRRRRSYTLLIISLVTIAAFASFASRSKAFLMRSSPKALGKFSLTR